MDRDKIIDKLNDIIRHEWTGVAQYAQYSFILTGLWREVYASEFEDSAEECFGHARKVGNKIVALGGVPAIQRNEVQQTADLQEMLQNSLNFEREAVRLYDEALTMAEDNAPLRVFLEDIILEEQEGAEHLEKVLREQATGKVVKGRGKQAAG